MVRRRSRRTQPSPPPTLWQRILAFFDSIKVSILAFVLMLVALNHLGAIDWVLDTLLRGHVADVNGAYLQTSKIEIGESILTLTALDTGLRVLESSTAGISFIAQFEVQVGAIVSALQDMVGRALDASLFAAGSLIAIELVLDLAELLSTPILTLAILVLGLHYIARGHWLWFTRATGQLADILIIFTVLVHLGFPLAIYGTSLASELLTKPLASQAHERFKATHADFSTSKQACKEKDRECTEDEKKAKVTHHVKAVISRYEATSDHSHHHRSRAVAGAVVRHVVAILFNAFVFPGILILITIWVTRVITRHTIRLEELIQEFEERPVGRSHSS